MQDVTTSIFPGGASDSVRIPSSAKVFDSKLNVLSLYDNIYFVDIWYSHFDLVLSTAYLYAKQAPAMGQFGSGNKKSPRQIDVSETAGTSHSESTYQGVFQTVGGYFEKIGPRIKQELGHLLS